MISPQPHIRKLISALMTFPSPKHDLKDLVVLVVEDQEIIRKIVLRVLKDLGITDVRCFKNGKEGLTFLAKHQVHLIIAEFGGHLDSLRMLETLRASPDPMITNMGFIMLVPHPHRKEVERVREAGADAVVSEPISPRVLAEHIDVVAVRLWDRLIGQR